VIRLLPPCNPQEVSKLHTHDVEFQMVYVLKGWVKSYLEGVGEQMMQKGSAWPQPPRVKHMILDYSDDVELLEVILPADFKTVELTAEARLSFQERPNRPLHRHCEERKLRSNPPVRLRRNGLLRSARND